MRSFPDPDSDWAIARYRYIRSLQDDPVEIAWLLEAKEYWRSKAARESDKHRRDVELLLPLGTDVDQMLEQLEFSGTR